MEIGGAFEIDRAKTTEEFDTAAFQLSSVKLLLSSDRNVETHDLLLATTFEYLDSGPKSSQEVLAHLEKVWAGLHISKRSVDEMLAAAELSKYVRTEQTLGSIRTWTLCQRGKLDVDGSRKWADDVLDRFTSEVERASQDQLGKSDRRTAERWTDLVLDALSVCLVDGFVTDPSKVEIVGERHLIPAGLDLKVLDTRIGVLAADPEVRDFLRSLARTALDASAVFGTELVHTLTLGYVLQAFAAGYDNAAEREAVGSFEDEVLILDTPVLLQLSGANAAAEPVWAVLKRAHARGVKIQLHSQTVDELQRVLLGRDEDAEEVEVVLRESAVEVEHLRASVRDQVLQLWLACEPEGVDAWFTWKQFRDRCEAVPTTIQAIGGEIGLGGSFLDVGLVDQFRTSIKASLRSRGKNRAPRNIDHDAGLLATLRTRRFENPPSEKKIWPGAIIVSTDTHLESSYRAVEGGVDEDFPAAVTLGQWAALLAKCCSPVEIEELAKAVSSEVSTRAALGRAVAIPLRTAISIAQSLKGSDISTIELESIQLSLDDLLSTQPDFDGSSPVAAQELAGEALAMRHARLEKVSKEHRHSAAVEVQELEKHLAVREAKLVTAAEAARDEADRERTNSQTLKGENVDLATAYEDLKASHETEGAERRTRTRRIWICLPVIVLLVSSIVALRAYELIGRRGLTVGLIGAGLLILASIDWVKNLGRDWIAIAVSLLGSSGWLAMELLLGAGKS